MSADGSKAVTWRTRSETRGRRRRTRVRGPRRGGGPPGGPGAGLASRSSSPTTCSRGSTPSRSPSARRSPAAASSCSSCSGCCSRSTSSRAPRSRCSGPKSGTTFHISSGAIVFIGTASSAFFVLGAVPMGWLADRVRRVPIVGIASLFFSFFVLLSGFAVNAFMLFWTRFATGHREVEQHPGAPVADRRQLPDRHPRPDVGGDEHGRARHRARAARCSPRRSRPGPAGPRAGAGPGTCSASRSRSSPSSRS